MKIRVTNIVFSGGEFTGDIEILARNVTEDDVHDDRQSLSLPLGYDTDENVAFRMLVGSMEKHNLTPIGVQRHGSRIVDALKADYPSLKVYVNPRTDAVMWPGFGSLDVTIDSGKKGWCFRPDHDSPWVDPGR